MDPYEVFLYKRALQVHHKDRYLWYQIIMTLLRFIIFKGTTHDPQIYIGKWRYVNFLLYIQVDYFPVEYNNKHTP